MKFLAMNVLSLCLASAAWGEATVTDAERGAESAKTLFSEKITPYAGSRQAVQNNLVNPLVSGGSMSSLDGATSFTSTALRSSSTPLMRVSVFANPPTGDLQRIIVEQDLTASGAFGAAAIFPIPAEASGQLISAVCANGYVMCDPGTYSNCRYREWKADSTGLIASVVAGGGGASGAGNVSTLSSCYCFNKACSNNNSAVLNLDNITANVGGGLLAAFIAARTGMMVTGAQSTGTGQITYSGVNAGSVPNGSNSTMTAEEAAAMPITPSADTNQIQAYYSSPGNLTALADSAKQQQISTPNSIFNSVATVAMHQVGTTVSCTNLMAPSLAVLERTDVQEGEGPSTFCADHQTYAIFNKPTESTFAIGVSGSGCSFPFQPPLNASGSLGAAYTFQQPSATTGFEITSVRGAVDIWGSGCNTGTSSAIWTPAVGLNSPIVTQTSAVCSDSGKQYPSFRWRIEIGYKSQEVTTIANLGCQQFEQNTSCRVQQEMWDGRPVIVNGLSTGFQLGQVCKDLAGPLRNARVCTPSNRLWFRQDKTFYCENSNPPYNFSGVQQRAKEVQNSTSMPTNATAAYTDGGIGYSFGTPQKGALAECSQVCRTKIPSSQAPMTAAGGPSTSVMTNLGVVGQSWSFFYKDCSGRPDGSWECPVDAAAGEEVVTQCGCSSDMGGVLGALTAANEAAQDSICSQD